MSCYHVDTMYCCNDASLRPVHVHSQMFTGSDENNDENSVENIYGLQIFHVNYSFVCVKLLSE